MRKSRIFERLKHLFNQERELSLTERTFPVNYNDYVVSWNDEFQRRVIEELIQRPKRERRLREEEIKFQDRLNRERLRKLQEGHSND